ncbi:MAG: hypothetical protein HY695_15805 [Deltaproteobacteria bacterium]|nr:hypothetical protein [Deltaproteobacteria bacterium]
MKSRWFSWLVAVLIGSALACPPVILAAEKETTATEKKEGDTKEKKAKKAKAKAKAKKGEEVKKEEKK